MTQWLIKQPLNDLFYPRPFVAFLAFLVFCGLFGLLALSTKVDKVEGYNNLGKPSAA